MKQLSFIPEIFIWLAFSVVAGFGYAFSFFEYVENHAQMSMTDIIIPTLVWILLAAICTFLLRIAQNTRCFVKLSRAESIFLECSILALLLIGGWVFRFVDYFHGVWPAGLDNTFFEYAQVRQEAIAYVNPHPASRLYVGFLHGLCMLLGNIYEIGALAQFLLLLAAAVVWYATIRKTLGVIAALFFAAGAMLLPDSIVMSMQCNPMMLLFLIYGCIIWLMVHYAYSKVSGIGAFIAEVFLGMLVIFAVFLDVSGILMVGAYLLAIYYRAKITRKGSPLTAFASSLGIVLGAMLFMLIQARAYHMSYHEAFNFHIYPQLALRFPDSSGFREFIFSLGTHPVFIVAIVVISIYWLLSRKQEFTWIMLAVLYLFSIQLLNLDVFLQHDFMIYMAISVLLGISVRQYLLPVEKDEADTYVMKNSHAEWSEPVVREIHFEDEPQITVPEHEKPLIFIPKSMEIPKRMAKPKVDFAMDVKEEDLHYDYAVDDSSDFDIS